MEPVTKKFAVIFWLCMWSCVPQVHMEKYGDSAWYSSNSYSQPYHQYPYFNEQGLDSWDSQAQQWFTQPNESESYFATTIESPLAHLRRDDDYGGYNGEYQYYYPAMEVDDGSSTAVTESSEEAEVDSTTTESPTTTTTTKAPFTISDVVVPIPFLRMEAMISFAFLGVLYGLGFFVFFQSLCVPAAKIAVAVVYSILLKLKAVKPIRLAQALEQLPPD